MLYREFSIIEKYQKILRSEFPYSNDVMDGEESRLNRTRRKYKITKKITLEEKE